MKLSVLYRLLNTERRLCRHYSLFIKKGTPEHFPTVNSVTWRWIQQDSAGRKTGLVAVEVMGNGNDGSARGVLLKDNHESYLFNCGEGFSRFVMEHKVKLGRVKNFFITYNSWQNVAGLPVVLLNFSHYVTGDRILHGPPNVEALLTATERFVNLQNFKLEKREYSKPPFCNNVGLKVEYVPLFGTKQLDGRRDVSVAYICKFGPSNRKLKVEKCVDYGVPIGPLLKELKKGHDVTLPNGTVIRSDDVCESGYRRTTVIVVECPNENFMLPLLEAQEFRPYQRVSSLADDTCEVVVHLSPNSIMQQKKYQQWMKRFSENVTHLVVNDSCPGQSSSSYYHFQDELRLLHEDVFPSLPLEQKSSNISFPGIRNVVLGEPLLQYFLQSDTPGVDRSRILSVNREDNVRLQAITSSPKVLDLLQHLKNNPLYRTMNQSTSAASYPEIVFLGTSSTNASTTRNCVSTLIHLSSEKAVMLDCGEGTFTQIVRMYGRKEAKNILRKLSAIFVSHMHIDHHLGLPTLLCERRKAFEESKLSSELQPVYVVYSPKLMFWLRNFHSMYGPILKDFKMIDFEELLHNRHKMDIKTYRKLMWDIGLKDVSAEKVVHFATPYGMILTDRNGWKLVYSGDTTPCDKLIEAGKNCDVLLHEATMEEELVAHAREKRHSTTNEAIEVGQKMGAKYTILTHISSRYRKIPLFTEKFNDTVGVAFDFMRVTKETLPIIPHFVPCLKKMYINYYERNEARTERMQQLRKQNEERIRRESSSSL